MLSIRFNYCNNCFHQFRIQHDEIEYNDEKYRCNYCHDIICLKCTIKKNTIENIKHICCLKCLRNYLITTQRSISKNKNKTKPKAIRQYLCINDIFNDIDLSIKFIKYKLNEHLKYF